MHAICLPVSLFLHSVHSSRGRSSDQWLVSGGRQLAGDSENPLQWGLLIPKANDHEGGRKSWKGIQSRRPVLHPPLDQLVSPTWYLLNKERMTSSHPTCEHFIVTTGGFNPFGAAKSFSSLGEQNSFSLSVFGRSKLSLFVGLL